MAVKMRCLRTPVVFIGLFSRNLRSPCSMFKSYLGSPSPRPMYNNSHGDVVYVLEDSLIDASIFPSVLYCSSPGTYLARALYCCYLTACVSLPSEANHIL